MNKYLKLILALMLSLTMIVTTVAIPDVAFAEEDISEDEISEEVTSGSEAYAELTDEEKQILDEANVDEDPLFYDYNTVDANGNVVPVKNSEISTMATETANSIVKLPSKYAQNSTKKCIDVSYWQSYKTPIDWKAVKAAGIDYAIIRVGYSGLSNGKHSADDYYKTNIDGAYKAGIKIGVYYYSTAKTAVEARSEADYFLNLIEPYREKIKLPVIMDYETHPSGRLTSSYLKSIGKTSVNKIGYAFCYRIKKAGYTPMFYSFYNLMTNYMDYKTFDNYYKVWFAHYTKYNSRTNTYEATGYDGVFGMWQYSSNGSVSGISGRVDMNVLFVGYWSEKEEGKYWYRIYNRYAKSQWVAHKGAWYYVDKNGQKVKAKVIQIGKYKYGFDNNGKRFENMKATFNKTYKYKFNKSGKVVLFTGKTTSKLNYRAEPSVSSKRMGSLEKGEYLSITRVEGDWGKLSVSGYWVNLDYVKKTITYPIKVK